VLRVELEGNSVVTVKSIAALVIEAEILIEF